MKLFLLLTMCMFFLVGCQQSGMSKSDVQNLILENNESMKADIERLSVRIAKIENQNTGNSDLAIRQLTQQITQIKDCISRLGIKTNSLIGSPNMGISLHKNTTCY